jgi:hypothetical protein
MIATRSPFARPASPMSHAAKSRDSRSSVEKSRVASMLVNAGIAANFLQLSPRSCGTLAYRPVSASDGTPGGYDLSQTRSTGRCSTIVAMREV